MLTFFFYGSSTGISTVVEVALIPFHGAKENVTLALPAPASAGTDTEPR